MRLSRYVFLCVFGGHKHGWIDESSDLRRFFSCFFFHSIQSSFIIINIELDKRAEMYDDGSGGGGDGDDDITVNGTPTFEMIEEDPIHPDLIETVVLCKNIRNAQVLTEAIRGFQGKVLEGKNE